MKLYLGIDLGSTTSKAIIVDEKGTIIGRGITNTRANYETAAEIARMEAEYNSRFSLLLHSINKVGGSSDELHSIINQVEVAFQYLQFHKRYQILHDNMRTTVEEKQRRQIKHILNDELDKVFKKIETDIRSEFLAGTVSTSTQFFRDIFSAHYMHEIESLEQSLFDDLVSIYEVSILSVENQVVSFDFSELVMNAVDLVVDNKNGKLDKFKSGVDAVASLDLAPADYIGTGYGRQLLPFEEKHIKSEILCHAFGAHNFFPKTRTVLDIGGQDTKAIQVDGHGLVTSFQMNDRCAAGCGRYLGYIADELSLSVSELGPMALECDYETNICSTCTVFAGAELRENLNLGEKRENILAGLHKAIVMRAFSLLARSGGVRNEFTFTGGVARNPAVVKYVSQMVKENYGDLTINIHPDSIFMGALGAALLSKNRRD
ncbi:MAG: benzoyl-CoA reductase subunit A [Candidatus Marinimicrobia bacterium]|nr:benzoyl-CoA reductase subunit A [Candidatus Neomarinimicrobiota bacterium]